MTGRAGPGPRRRGPAFHRRLAVPLWLAVAALAGCSGGGVSYTLHLVNRDTVALDSVTVTGGAEARLGSVAAGGAVAGTVVVRRDVGLHLNGMRGPRPFRFFLGYFAGRGPDADLILTVTPGGDLRVGALTPH